MIAATLGAFVLAQQLKSDFPLVIRFATKPAHFSPNGDRYRDTTTIGFDLSEPASVSFMVVAAGTYRMRVVRRDESRVIDSVKEIDVDTVPPPASLASAKPSVIATDLPGETPTVRLAYRGPENRAPVIRVFRTDDGKPHIVRRFRGRPDRTATWDGRVSAGEERTEAAPEGDYAFTVAVRDRAGNVTEAPLPTPTASVAGPGTGVTVSNFTLRGPLSAVAAGQVAHLEVGPVDRSFDFAVSRLGDPKPLLKGGRVAGRFRIHIPSKMRTGVYIVRVRSRDERAVWPLAMAGLPPRSARGEARPLVVLPALTWQGLNRVDDDADGFADRLPFARSVRVDRPFLDGTLPKRFDAEVSPLLRWLDREKLPYDLTTDLALARHEGPALGNAPGVAVAGSELWLSDELLKRLRDYVADGGRLASFGTESFRRAVTLKGAVISDPTRRRREDALGERTKVVATSSAPLTVFEDSLGLFEGVSGFLGDFTVFETTAGLPQSARRMTEAGRDPGQPAFVAFGLGGGVVIRSGTPQWARELNESALSLELPQVTKRIWKLLSGGSVP